MSMAKSSRVALSLLSTLSDTSMRRAPNEGSMSLMNDWHST